MSALPANPLRDARLKPLPLALACVLLSACGGQAVPEAPRPGTQIHSGNLLDVYAIGRNELAQSQQIEQLWGQIAKQLPGPTERTGRFSCPHGGMVEHRQQGQLHTLSFERCDTGTWRLDSGSLSRLAQGPDAQDWTMQARELRIRSSQAKELASVITADIQQHLQADARQLTRSGRYAVAYKGRVDSVSLTASYRLGGSEPQLQSYSLNLFPPRFSQQLSITQAAADPDTLIIKSVGDSSTLIGTAQAQALALTWHSGDGNRRVHTASLAALDAAYRRVD